MHAPFPSIPRSVLFQAPGRPLAASRQHLARERVAQQVFAAAAERGWRAIGDLSAAAPVQLRGDAVTPAQLGDGLEDILDRAAACLDADLIGGTNVTRLDRSITCAHARLPYRKALRVANGRGWSLALGEEIPAGAQATLVRFCGLLPVQVPFLPGQPRPAALDVAVHGLVYILPLAGEAVRAVVGAGSEGTVCTPRPGPDPAILPGTGRDATPHDLTDRGRPPWTRIPGNSSRRGCVKSTSSPDDTHGPGR